MTGLSSQSDKPNRQPSQGGLVVWLKRHKDRLLLWLRLGIAVVLMAFVISLVGQDQDKLRDVNWTLIPLAWLLMLASTGVKAYRWGLLVRQSKMKLSFRRLVGSYLVGAFFSTVLPTSVGGDAVRAVETANSTGRAADSTSSVLIERGIGLLTVIGAGSLFALFLDAGSVPLAFQLMVHAMFAAGIAGFIMLRLGWFIGPVAQVMAWFNLGGLANKVRHLQTAMNEHLDHPLVLVQMVILSALANALTMGATYLVLVAVTDPIPVAAFVPMIALTTTAELIPISIASLGVKESAYVFFLGLASVGSTEAGVIAIIMRVLTWGHALLGGLIFLSRTVSAPKDQTARA
ncbi:MAG: flippase-like domain-containing protein [Anaerolineae bacterium]|nr:flippase-like domain-containing protein [Anaerolineae bacterium]